ncbi:MAG: PorT family protein [Bacteroidetes bacterium]|nr:PorT family protein [Bacteroidota bacterium]MCL2302390.1 PorT family protein [Lentimicrobiaceae bacterium]
MSVLHKISHFLSPLPSSGGKPPSATFSSQRRRNFSAFCLLLSAFCFLPSASAQRFIGGLAVGMNLSQVDGDEVFGYNKVGFNGGPYVKFMLDKKQRFSLTMELLYTQKGAVKKYPAPNGVRVALEDTALIDPRFPEYNTKYFYNLRTDYLEIPLLVHYDDPKSKISIGVGITWARLVYIKEMQHDFRRSDTIRGARRLTTAINSGRYNRNDWGIIADVKIPVYKGLKFNFRFQYSIVPFGKERRFYNSTSPNFEGSILRKPYHNTLTFRLIYSFNEKYTENTNYDKEGNRIGPRWIRDPEAMKW